MPARTMTPRILCLPLLALVLAAASACGGGSGGGTPTPVVLSGGTPSPAECATASAADVTNDTLLTLPFPPCTAFQVRYNPTNKNGAMYTVAAGTRIVAPIDGVLSVQKAEEGSLFGPGGVVLQFQNADRTLSTVLQFVEGSVNDALSGQLVARGTVLGATGADLPDAISGGHASLLLVQGDPKNAPRDPYDLADPARWVQGNRNIFFKIP